MSGSTRKSIRQIATFGALLALLHIPPARLAGAPDEPVDTPVFDIPRLADIAIDGNPGDWDNHGFCVEAMAAADGSVKSTTDLDCRFSLGWDDRGLLVALTVRDNIFIESDDADSLWRDDCVELFLADRRGSSQVVQAVIAPGVDSHHPESRWRLYDHRKDEALRKTPPSLTTARTKTHDGYVMEVLFPWENVGVRPAPGVEVGFQVFCDDVDITNARLFSAVWYPAVGAQVNPMRMHRLRLADRASAPVLAVGRARYEGMKGTRAIAVGTRELAGKPVAVQADGEQIARGTLTEAGGRAWANLQGPLAPFPKQWKLLQILVEEQIVDTVAMPDLATTRSNRVPELQYRFNPFCFAGSQFPDGGFYDPREAGNVLGPYSVKLAFYDARFNPVIAADAPGRYGAIVEIRPKGGTVIKQYCTLFRMPRDVDWWHAEPFVKMAASVSLPAEFGISPTVVKEQAQTLDEYAERLAIDAFANSPDSAIVMAALSETASGTRITERNNPWNKERRWMHELKRRTDNAIPLQYLVHLPAGVETGAVTKCPAILFLHGSGERGLSLETLNLQQPLLKYSRSHTNFPFIVITPQCPPNQWWQPASLDDLYDEVTAKYPIDPDRFYLTGLSMGGYGSWMLAIEHPDRFAAVAPVCGGGDPQDIERIADVPVWNFHGARDRSVPITRSDEMISALRDGHGRVRYTVYPEGEHAIWKEVYNIDDLYAWFLQQARGKPNQPRATMRGNAPDEEREIAKP